MRKRAAAMGSAAVFLAAPGVVAGLVPWLLTGWRVRAPVPYLMCARVLGAALLVARLVALIQAFWRFVVEGLGTPAPVAAPDRLVVGGPYRYVRNPMYVAVLAVIIGQALLLGQPILLAYAVVLWLIVASFVRFYEEPTLSRRFGTEYEAYRRAVPAWRLRLRPWRPGETAASGPQRGRDEGGGGRPKRDGAGLLAHAPRRIVAPELTDPGPGGRCGDVLGVLPRRFRRRAGLVGYATDPVQDWWGALGAGVLLGLVWAVYHYVPLLQAHRSPAWIG